MDMKMSDQMQSWHEIIESLIQPYIGTRSSQVFKPSVWEQIKKASTYINESIMMLDAVM